MPAEKRPVPRARQTSLDEAPVPYGRLVRYEISGLFGQHDHAFDLELEEPTILTGANGTGKSTILRTINAIGTGAWPQLFALPFKSLTLRFEHSPLIRVTRLKGSLKVEHGGEAWRLNARDQRVRMQAAGLDLEVPLDQFEFDEPGLSQAAKAERVYRSLGAQRAWRHERDLFEAGEIPEPLREISKRIRVRFVTDQRLVLYGDVPRRPGRPEKGEDVRHAALEYSNELRRLMSRELARYAAASQREDRAFPRLVVEAMSAGGEADLHELHGLLDEVGDRRAELQRVGLLESDSDAGVEPFELTSLQQEKVSPVIKTFAEVTLRKFDMLEPFRRRLQLFVDFLDEHFVDKHTITTDERGLEFELGNGAVVSPFDLSSGEQQMLVLAYQLLFQSSPGTLLLVDEPEISLHVGWQSSFVDDITEMGRDRGLQFLLASHSPVLIGGREDLKRSLDKPRR